MMKSSELIEEKYQEPLSDKTEFLPGTFIRNQELLWWKVPN